jgi:hypothetical protein
MAQTEPDQEEGQDAAPAERGDEDEQEGSPAERGDEDEQAASPAERDDQEERPVARAKRDGSAEEPESFARRARPAPRPGSRGALSPAEIDAALRHGRAEKGRNQALVLRDAGRAISNALNALADEPTEGSGFWIEVYTPFSWVAQLSSDAAKQYRDIFPEDLQRGDLAGLLRVIVHPDMPDRVSRRGMRLSASVEHVVIRPRGRRDARSLQPVSKRTFDETTVGRYGREVTFGGVEALFRLPDVIDVIRESRNGELDVIVIGERNREKTFGIKRRHFDQLPGLPYY